MTAAEKARVIAIWTAEDFRGSREDARRMALAGTAQAVDMFAGELFELADNTNEQEQDDPNQLTLF